MYIDTPSYYGLTYLDRPTFTPPYSNGCPFCGNHHCSCHPNGFPIHERHCFLCGQVYCMCGFNEKLPWEPRPLDPMWCPLCHSFICKCFRNFFLDLQYLNG